MRRQWKHFITFLVGKVNWFFFFLPDKPFAYDNDALMQNLTFSTNDTKGQRGIWKGAQTMRLWETKRHEISCNSTFHKTCLRLRVVNVKEIGANLKRWWGNVITHKQGQHAAGDCQPKQDGGLWFRRGQHCTFSPSVSCTALGSAARLARPLAWAIWRYMDV